MMAFHDIARKACSYNRIYYGSCKGPKVARVAAATSSTDGKKDSANGTLISVGV
jgi:hypothetical protein